MFFPLPPLDISTALKWISKTNRNALNIFHKEVVVSPNLLKLLLVDFHRLSEYLIKIFKKKQCGNVCRNTRKQFHAPYALMKMDYPFIYEVANCAKVFAPK